MLSLITDVVLPALLIGSGAALVAAGIAELAA